MLCVQPAQSQRLGCDPCSVVLRQLPVGALVADDSELGVVAVAAAAAAAAAGTAEQDCREADPELGLPEPGPEQLLVLRHFFGEVLNVVARAALSGSFEGMPFRTCRKQTAGFHIHR